jgi:hypothetical protein
MNKTPMLDRVREVCREVAGRAQYVTIDEERIASYAASIPQDVLGAPRLDEEYHYLGRGEETAAYLVTLAAVNFGSGYFPVLRKPVKTSGYYSMARALRNRFIKRGPLSADDLIRIDADDCAKTFGQDRHNETVRELMKQFSMSMNELGRHLLDHYDGSFVKLIEAGQGSAEELVETIAMMSRFDDVAFYLDLDVPFYKRAQLAVADLSIALPDQKLGRIEGLDRLTSFADNQVPHVLRIDGVLRYKESLAEHVDAGHLIAAQSVYEVEIRAAAVHAVELLVAELRRQGREVNAMRVDYFLWNRGLEPMYRSLPAHLTRTIFY